jgi:hypothetical protein
MSKERHRHRRDHQGHRDQTEAGQRSRNQYESVQRNVEHEDNATVKNPCHLVRPVSSGGHDDFNNLNLFALGSARLRVCLAQGDHGHHGCVFDDGDSQDHHGQRDKPERHRLAASSENRERGDRNADPQCLRNEPEEHRQTQLLRVGSGIHEKSRRAEERRLEGEVHRSTANHLGDYKNANDASCAPWGSHSRAPLRNDVRSRSAASLQTTTMTIAVSKDE